MLNSWVARRPSESCGDRNLVARQTKKKPLIIPWLRAIPLSTVMMVDGKHHLFQKLVIDVAWNNTSLYSSCMLRVIGQVGESISQFLHIKTTCDRLSNICILIFFSETFNSYSSENHKNICQIQIKDTCGYLKFSARCQAPQYCLPTCGFLFFCNISKSYNAIHFIF